MHRGIETALLEAANNRLLAAVFTFALYFDTLVTYYTLSRMQQLIMTTQPFGQASLARLQQVLLGWTCLVGAIWTVSMVLNIAGLYLDLAGDKAAVSLWHSLAFFLSLGGDYWASVTIGTFGLILASVALSIASEAEGDEIYPSLGAQLVIVLGVAVWFAELLAAQVIFHTLADPTLSQTLASYALTAPAFVLLRYCVVCFLDS